MKINGRKIALLMFLAMSSGFLMGSHGGFRAPEPTHDENGEVTEFGRSQGHSSDQLSESQLAYASEHGSMYIQHPTNEGERLKVQLPVDTSLSFGEDSLSSNPLLVRSDLSSPVSSSPRDPQEQLVVTSWSGKFSSAWANRPTVASMRSSVSSMFADVKSRLGFTPTDEESAKIEGELQAKVSSWPTLPTKLQIQQLIQDAIDALRNLRNPANRKVFTKLSEDGSYEKVITDPTGKNPSDIVESYDAQGKQNADTKEQDNMSYPKTAAFRLNQAQENLASKLSSSEDVQGDAVAALKTLQTSQLLEFLRTAPTDESAGPITRSRVLSALSSNAADATGITAMRNAMQPDSPQRQALDLQVAKINQAMSRALDRIFGQRQMVKSPDEDTVLQTRTQQMVKGLQDAFTALKKQFTPSTSQERIATNISRFDTEELAARSRNDAMVTSAQAQRPRNTSMVDSQNPTQPTAYSKFLRDRSYADMRADLANPKLAEGNQNGYTSRQQVATDMANKMLQDSGLAQYVVPANRAIGRQMTAAQRAISTQIGKITDMFTRKVTVDAEQLPVEQKPNFISKAFTDMYNSITGLANRIMGRPATTAVTTVDPQSLDEGSIEMVGVSQSSLVSTKLPTSSSSTVAALV